MKKKLSIIGTLLILVSLLLPIFQPVLTALAEETKPELVTVSFNGKEIKKEKEFEAGGNDIIKLKAKENFSLKIPQSDQYEIGLLSEEEQEELKSKAKENEKLVFDVTVDEENYHLQMEKDTELYFKVRLLGESAILEGTASFADVNRPETKLEMIHLVQPTEPEQPVESEPEVSEPPVESEPEVSEPPVETPASNDEEPQEVIPDTPEESTEPVVETKEVVFYKDGDKLDEETTLTAEEGKTFNPVENVTAKSPDGTEEYQVKAEVEADGEKLKLKDETFVPETEKNYLIQYSAIEEGQDEPITTLGVGLRASNGNLDVSLEWSTSEVSQKTNLTQIVSQTDPLRLITYKLSIITTEKTYKKGEIRITLPKGTIQFDNPKGLDEFSEWHEDHIGFAKIGTSKDIFGYEKGSDGSLIITNQKDIDETIHETYELSMRMAYYGGIRARMIYDGTKASFAYDVEDKSQTDESKKKFKTNTISVTLQTTFAQPTTKKTATPFNPYEWDSNEIGQSRPTDFNKYRWIKFDIMQLENLANGKNLVTNFTDTFQKERNGSVSNLSATDVNNLKIYAYFKPQKYFETDQYYVRDKNAGLDDRTISSTGGIVWSSKTNREHRNFTGTTQSPSSGIEQHFYLIVGFNRDLYEPTDTIHNTITTEYYDGDNQNPLGSGNAAVKATFSEFDFIYPPGNLTNSSKDFGHPSGGRVGEVYYSLANGSRVKEGFVIPLLKSGTDVTLRSARTTYTSNHPNEAYTKPHVYEILDDHAKWKTGSTSVVDMKAEDYYFSKIHLQTETILPNRDNETNQEDGVKLPHLQIQYQDDDTGEWKKHPTLIAPEIYPNAGTNPDGTKYDKYGWGIAQSMAANDNAHKEFNLVEDYGIQPYRLRLVTVDENGDKSTTSGVMGRVTVSIRYEMTIRGMDPNDNNETQLEKWDKNNQLRSLTIHNFTGFKVEEWDQSNKKYDHVNPDHDENNDRFDTDPSEFDDFLERREANHTLTLEDPKSFIRKKVDSVRNYALEKSNIVDWEMEWAEGYDIGVAGSSEEIKTLFDQGKLSVPNREHVYVRDLLPAGHTFSEINTLQYRDEDLKDSQYTMKITKNYKNTGRDFIEVLIFPESVSSKSGYSSEGNSEKSRLIRGNNIKFYYSTKVAWADRFLANENATSYNRNSIAVQLFKDDSTPVAMLGEGRTGTNINNELKSIGGHNNNDLGYVDQSSGSIIKNGLLAYASATITGETSVQTGLSKFIRADEDGALFNTSGSGKYSSAGKYEYRLDYRADASAETNHIKNVILFDQLEHVLPGNGQQYSQGWKGTLEDVDISYAISKGVDAKVYVNENLITPFAPGGGSLTGNGWKLFNKTMSEPDRKKIKTVAIDLTQKVGGGTKEFLANDYVNVTLKMKMPNQFPAEEKAYNSPWLSATRVTSTQENNAVTQGVYTDFRVFKNPDLTIIKQDLESSSKLQGVVFEIEYPDGGKRNFSTDSQGEIELKDLEPGKYKLRETSSKVGYEPLTETYEFTVKSDGTIEHPEDTTYWKYDFNDNTIKLNVYNRKKFTLPFTGGSGAGLNLLAIVALMVIAGVGLYLKKYRFTA